MEVIDVTEEMLKKRKIIIIDLTLTKRRTNRIACKSILGKRTCSQRISLACKSILGKRTCKPIDRLSY